MSLLTPPLGGRPRPAARRFRPALEPLEGREVPARFEVWTIDQSNTRDETGNGSVLDPADSGGTLYVYPGDALAGRAAAAAAPGVVDLGGAARDLAVAQTGTPAIRPHMLFLNSTGSHAILSYVASGHVLFLDAATRTPVRAIDVGVQAHAAIPAPDDSYVIVANQNGKLLHRIWTDYATNTFTLDPVPLDLASGATPGGAPRQDPALRPDNAPICPVVDSSSRITFVTLRGGGLFVVDTRAPVMGIVAEYDRAAIHHDGCLGVEANGKMYLNSGGPGEHDVYALRLADFAGLSAAAPSTTPNGPARALVYTRDGGQVDSHGGALTGHGRYLWVADRWANEMVVVDTETDQVVNTFPLTGAASADPAPDLMVTSPGGNRVFAALRGPVPLTGNNAVAGNAVGVTPGVGIIRVEQNGRRGVLQAVAPISHVVGGVERADPHAIAIRMVGAATGAYVAAASLVAAGGATPARRRSQPRRRGEVPPPAFPGPRLRRRPTGRRGPLTGSGQSPRDRVATPGRVGRGPL